MRQQVYNCVVSAAFRHHCNVVAPSKRFCHTVGWLNLLLTWEFPGIMASYIKWVHFVPHFQHCNLAFVYRSECKRWSLKRETVENCLGLIESGFNQVCYLNASEQFTCLGLFLARLQRNEPFRNTLFKICLLLLVEETMDVNQCQSLVWASISLVGDGLLLNFDSVRRLYTKFPLINS